MARDRRSGDFRFNVQKLTIPFTLRTASDLFHVLIEGRQWNFWMDPFRVEIRPKETQRSAGQPVRRDKLKVYKSLNGELNSGSSPETRQTALDGKGRSLDGNRREKASNVH